MANIGWAVSEGPLRNAMVATVEEAYKEHKKQVHALAHRDHTYEEDEKLAHMWEMLSDMHAFIRGQGT